MYYPLSCNLSRSRRNLAGNALIKSWHLDHSFSAAVLWGRLLLLSLLLLLTVTGKACWAPAAHLTTPASLCGIVGGTLSSSASSASRPPPQAPPRLVPRMPSSVHPDQSTGHPSPPRKAATLPAQPDTPMGSWWRRIPTATVRATPSLGGVQPPHTIHSVPGPQESRVTTTGQSAPHASQGALFSAVTSDDC